MWGKLELVLDKHSHHQNLFLHFCCRAVPRENMTLFIF